MHDETSSWEAMSESAVDSHEESSFKFAEFASG